MTADTVAAQMKRLTEIDSELDALDLSSATGAAIFDRLEEHARLRIAIALGCSEAGRRLRPIPAEPDPAYFDRLDRYFASLEADAHAQRVPGARIAAESIATDGRLAVGQLQCAVEGRRQLVMGHAEEAVKLTFAATRGLGNHTGWALAGAASVKASQNARKRQHDRSEWHDRRVKELRAQGCSVAEAGREIAKEEWRRRRRAELLAQGCSPAEAERRITKEQPPREEIQKQGENIVRSVRRRCKDRGEPFPSPAANRPK